MLPMVIAYYSFFGKQDIGRLRYETHDTGEDAIKILDNQSENGTENYQTDLKQTLLAFIAFILGSLLLLRFIFWDRRCPFEVM